MEVKDKRFVRLILKNVNIELGNVNTLVMKYTSLMYAEEEELKRARLQFTVNALEDYYKEVTNYGKLLMSNLDMKGA